MSTDFRTGAETMEKKLKKDNFILYFTNFSRVVLYLFALGMLLWLNRNGIVNGKQWFGDISGMGMLLMRGVLFAGILAASIIVGWVLAKIEQYNSKTEWLILSVCSLLFWGICMWWVSQVPYKMDGDQLIVWYNAVLATENEFPMYVHAGQMYIYPQQQGLALLYELLFRLTGSTDHRMIGYLNATLAPFTLCFGYLCVKQCFSKKAALCFLPFMMMFLPYIIYSPYVYGDIPSVCYGFILFWAILKVKEAGEHDEKKKNSKSVWGFGILACLIAAVALMSRMNMWIFLIGLTIGLLYLALKRWSMKPLLLGICVILSASLSMTAVKQFNSYRSGEPVSDGMPAILWVAMGLQDSYWGAGYYNNYSKEVYQNADCDGEVASAIGMQEVKERVRFFIDNPEERKAFFDEKMRSQWMDPLFESTKFTGIVDEEAGPPSDFINWIYRGEGHERLSRFCSHLLAAVYFFAFLGVLGRFFEKRPIVQDCPLIIFVGGFLFSIIWEAKGRYMLPYFVLLIMYAAGGLAWSTHIIKRIFRKYKAVIKE